MTHRNAPKLAVKQLDCTMRNVRTRMPFRYGVATLTAVPILHTLVTVEINGSERVQGISADILPPKWFDKRPVKSYEDNVFDLLRSLEIATTTALGERHPATVFDLWLRLHHATLDAAPDHDLNALTAAHGPTLLERALIDAVAKHAKADFHRAVRGNLLGIRASAIHAELDDDAVLRHLPAQPLPCIRVRHTVGLSDPLTESDLAQTDIPEDGLPRTLEDYLARTGITMLKIKIRGDLDADLERLGAIAELLEHYAGRDYGVSLDGNEQYENAEELMRLLDAMQKSTALRHFLHHTLYIEQPLDRSRALAPELEPSLRQLSELKPVIIDESDQALDAFAKAAAIGYRGVSSKNCKGVQKAIVNSTLAAELTARHGRPYFITGEDLMNLPIVSLHQDLATLSTLGIGHAERNGHHYVAGLNHLTPGERAACLSAHAALYEPWGADSARLRIVNGAVSLASLNRTPGYAVGVSMDLDAMTPLDQWEFASLGVE